MQEDELLKAYTGINKDPDHPLIKILVSYIKPSYLFKSDVLTPIHLGRAVEREDSKDGTITDTDIEWLHKNCIGDDDFEGNISAVNRRVGFLTGTYWAWKNYDKLGNPEYFGSFGYRRLFNPKFLVCLKDFDIITPPFLNTHSTNKLSLINSHGESLYNVTKQVFKELNLNWNEFENYLNLDSGYYFEQYIMKRNIFFEFCKWISPILFKLIERINEIKIDSYEKEKILNYFKIGTRVYLCNSNNFEIYQYRNIGFMLERLTGYYLYTLVNTNNIKSMAVNTEEFQSDYKRYIIANIRKRIKENAYNCICNNPNI